MKCPRCGGEIVERKRLNLGLILRFCKDIKKCSWSEKIKVK